MSRAVELARDTIFATLAGSHAHGTARAGSDLDLRGVCVAPLALRVALFERFEQWEGTPEGSFAALLEPALRAHPLAAQNLGEKREAVIFDLAKFLKLCCEANPNALEILCADERDWLHATPLWRRVHAERRLFLTRQVERTFLGYAAAQLQRIRSHRAWLLEPPREKPTRAAFGLPEEATLGREDRDRIDEALAERLRATREEGQPSEARREQALRSLGLPRDVVHALGAERRYRAALKHWQAYQTWKAERNPARAELERRFGYDTKHAAHLVRLMRMGLELLQHGELHVRRADAEELRAIRDGALSYDELLAQAAALEARVAEAARETVLPAEVDRGAVEELWWELVRS
ncbi:MAG: nucleotidyltransferase domain-containing protein [Planctomycetes bacterium]|nr:nucleotidyltransferase domain-containing protein [Planctomycetota bacterium]